VLRSVSRTMPDCVAEEFRETIIRARESMATYEDMEELIRLGAYRKGSDPLVDRAIELRPDLEAFLNQTKAENSTIEDGYLRLAGILEDRGGDQNDLDDPPRP